MLAIRASPPRAIQVRPFMCSVFETTWLRIEKATRPKTRDLLKAKSSLLSLNWEFGEGVDSARGVVAIVVWCCNSSCNSSCDAIARNGGKRLHSFCCFECNRLFAIARVKGRSKHVSSVACHGKYCSRTPCRFHPFSKHPT